MAPILVNIKNEFISVIDAMSPNTYNLRWGDTNQYDYAMFNTSGFEANALLKFVNEDNIDDLGGAHNFAYMNEVNMTIEIRCPLKSAQANIEANDGALSDAEDRYLLAIDDLKLAFGLYQSNYVQLIQYLSFRKMDETMAKGDAVHPIDYETKWLVRYSQDRSAPETQAVL